jgi:3-hydroxybutyryl-CoA dehydrogenase
MAGPRTDPAQLDRVAAALVRAGKTPLVLRRPIVGHLVNRLQHALLHEAYHLIAEGVVTVAEVDLVARMTLGPRMCVTGLIEQKDISGLVVHAASQRGIVPALAHTNRPVALLQDLEAAGDLGLSTGRGFYDWRHADAAAVRTETARRLRAVIDFLEGLGPRPPATRPADRSHAP